MTASRTDCYALLMRLHFAEYLHGSFFERNIVVQPGPLTKPPYARSMETPSFRLIDFGRTITYEDFTKKNHSFKPVGREQLQEALNARTTLGFTHIENV